MMKITSILLFFSILGIVFFNYEIKNNYTYKADQIQKLKKEISKKNENLKLMTAEHAFLSRPDRLEYIAKNKLNMKEILASDIWNINDLSKLYFEKQ